MVLFDYIDVCVALSYLIVCLFIGLYKAKSIKSLKQFAIGAGNAKATVLIAVIFATVTGAGSTIGIVGKVYLLGLLLVGRQIIEPIYWLLSAKIFANNIEQFRGCLTVSHVMYKLYGNTGRLATSILSLIISAGIIAAQATAIGHVFHYFFKLDINHGIFISYGILTLYSALGGIRSVVFTEIFQFVVFFLIIPVSCAFYFYKVGDIENVILSLPANYTQFELGDSSIALIFGVILHAFMPDCSGPNMQRYLMASSSAELKKSFKMIALISVFFTIALCCIAYLVKATAPDVNPSEVLFYFTNQLPVGLKGLMIAGMFAIIMSTAESWVNSAAVIAVNDVVNPLMPKLSMKWQLVLVRLFTVLLSVFSIAIALRAKGIMELIFMLDSLWDPIVLVPIAAGFLGFRTNSKTFIANVVISLIFCIIGRLIVGEFGIISLAVGLLGSVIGFFGTHYLQVYNGTINEPLPRLSFKFPKFANPFASFPRRVRQFQDSVWRENPRFAVFGGFVLNYYFAFCFFLKNNPTNLILLTMLIIGYVISGPLLMRDVFFSKKFQKKYLPFYWYFVVAFCLPCIGSYCLLASNGSDLWIVNGLIFTSSVFYFLSALSSIVVITIGSLLGYAIFASTHSYLGITLNTTPLLLPYVYLFIFTIIILFIHHKEKHHKEKIESMQALGGTIAHEVRSPIASMSMLMENIRLILDRAMETAKDKEKYYHIKLDKEDYEMLAGNQETITKLGARGIDTIKSILLSFRTSAEEDGKAKYFIKDLINSTLSEYSIYNSATRNVGVKILKNFVVECNPEYFKQMLANLLKNAYKYNGSNVKVDIVAKNHNLYFTDYGNGISKDIMPYIFDRFYTKGSGGTGLGLAFCKMVMESLGGDITCQSTPGKHTRFNLRFPKASTAQV